jgi:MinD-like ATPase involved in chromosome partitioning or flagellar assembly
MSAESDHFISLRPADADPSREQPGADPGPVIPAAAPSGPPSPSQPASAPPHDGEVTTNLPVLPAEGPHPPPQRPDPPTTAATGARHAATPLPARSKTLALQQLSATPAPRDRADAIHPLSPWTAAGSEHRALDALAHLGLQPAVTLAPQRGWRHWVHVLTRINLGPSPDELYELDLHTRIRRNPHDSYQIGVLGLKGGVGKTAITVALGSALSAIRGDRILAIDADPDAGNLADRAGRQSPATINDLLSDQELHRYNDIRAYTNMNGANLEVLSSQDYSAAHRAFNDQDWRSATEIVSRYYNLVLADGGAGLFHPGARAVLSTVSGLVIVASASIDGARQAAITMDWLRQNGHQDLLSRSCVVINQIVPGTPTLDIDDLVEQFERHTAPGRVIVLPWDTHIATGTHIQLHCLGPVFRRRITELAAALSDDFTDNLQRS